MVMAKSTDTGFSWRQVADTSKSENLLCNLRDHPWIAAARSAKFDGLVCVTRATFDDVTSRARIIFTRSDDGGQCFLLPMVITTQT